MSYVESQCRAPRMHQALVELTQNSPIAQFDTAQVCMARKDLSRTTKDRLNRRTVNGFVSQEQTAGDQSFKSDLTEIWGVCWRETGSDILLFEFRHVIDTRKGQEFLFAPLFLTSTSVRLAQDLGIGRSMALVSIYIQQYELEDVTLVQIMKEIGLSLLIYRLLTIVY